MHVCLTSLPFLNLLDLNMKFLTIRACNCTSEKEGFIVYRVDPQFQLFNRTKNELPKHRNKMSPH
jgi:hypothetical protein